MTGVKSGDHGTGIHATAGRGRLGAARLPGIDPETRRQRWLTKTVHGTERFACTQLEDLVVESGRVRIRAGTLADLLDRWLESASPGWSASTVSHTRSIVDCHLRPHLGHLDLAKLTTADIDDLYGYLLRAGGREDRPLAPGTVARVHGVLHRALAQAVRWDWIWLNPASSATAPRVAPSEAPAQPGPGGRAPRMGEAGGSAALLLPEDRGVGGSLSEPAAGASVGGRRRRTSRDRVHPRPHRRPRRPRAPLHQDTPRLAGRARRLDARRVDGASLSGQGSGP